MHTAINDDKAHADTTSGSIIVFVVGGEFDSPMGFRARALAARLAHCYSISIVYCSRRKIISILRLFITLARLRPRVSYVFDISYSGVLAATFYRMILRNCMIIETGDAIVELVRSTGSRGKVGLWLTQLLEKIALRCADRIVVRGSFHKEWLSRIGVAADVIQDGVDTETFKPADASELRKRYGLDGVMTVGLIGSSVWSEKLQMCYGWELVEILRLLRGKAVKGIMIGSGSGIPHLEALCREYEIQDKMIFIGHVPYQELPLYLNLIDVCLSTQTNNLVGQVRTTGKLPLYLAAGRYVLASNVGEAARVLEKEMLVDYVGLKDQEYPQKLKARIEQLMEQPKKLELGARNVALARKYFDYGMLALRMKQVIEATLSARNAGSGGLSK
jgi:glycosyltransferase involved in cell wall biosynthesis